MERVMQQTSLHWQPSAALVEGRVDVVGDVHGEMGALLCLMVCSGYDSSGAHPENATLVFVGDLVDKGPDSVAVVLFVRNLCRRGRAQCVMGNHELNLLIGHEGTCNAWFWKQSQHTLVPCQRRATDTEREDILNFLKTLPLVLERSDLRVVHACWDSDALEQVSKVAVNRDVQSVYTTIAKTITDQVVNKADILSLRCAMQNNHGIKSLTSGKEHIPTPAFADRHLTRVRWWEQHKPEKLTIIGHYTRIPRQTCMDHNLLLADPVNDCLDCFDLLPFNVVCVDIGGSVMHKLRVRHVPHQASLGLAAVTVPGLQMTLSSGLVCKP